MGTIHIRIILTKMISSSIPPLQVHPGLGDQEVRNLFKGIDVDDSGHIDVTEFVAATIPSLAPNRQEELLRTSFQRLDRRGSGFIPKQELMSALCQVGIKVRLFVCS